MNRSIRNPIWLPTPCCISKKIGLTYVLSCITNKHIACYTYTHCYNFLKHYYNYKTLLQCFKNHCNYYEAAFGCLTSILNGKCWTNEFRAFRMLVDALLHDFLSDGEKSYNAIVVYLERARSHPTGKMWVDTTIYPTFLAMELVRAERGQTGYCSRTACGECFLYFSQLATTGMPGIPSHFY